MQSTLKKLGLNKNEIKIYLALLQYGGREASFIAIKTNINRGTIYGVLDEMVKKNIVTQCMRGGVRHFSACPPEQIAAYLERESQKFQLLKHDLEKIVPDLKRLANTAQGWQPKIQYFEGIEGVKQSYCHVLDNAPDKLDAYFSVIETIQPELQEFFTKEYVTEKARKKIFTRNITIKCPKTKWYMENSKKLCTEFRFMGEGVFPVLNSEINLYGDYMHCMSFDEHNGFAFIVKNKQMVDLHRALFEIAWNSQNNN